MTSLMLSAPGHLNRLLPRFVVGACAARPFVPRWLDRLERARRRGEFRHAGIDQQVGLIDAPELFGAGVHVDELLLRPRHVDQRVVDRRPFAEPRADDEQQVASL